MSPQEKVVLLCEITPTDLPKINGKKNPTIFETALQNNTFICVFSDLIFLYQQNNTYVSKTLIQLISIFNTVCPPS